MVRPLATDSADSPAPARRRRWVWTAPVAVVAVVAAGAVAFNVSTADAAPTLPSRSAQQLIAGVLGSSTQALSGTVTTAANLGLPSLPGTGGDASLSWLSFLTGTHTARVWVDGPERQRLAVTGQLSEATVIRNGADVWTYTSGSNTVSHQMLPDRSATAPTEPTDITPDAAARKFLDAVSDSTAVDVADNRSVAGRSAYTLMLTPRDSGTTVRRVEIAVDAATNVPLQFQIYGAGNDPAFSTGFTSVDFSTPDASTFDFTPPAGATVTDNPFGLPGRDGSTAPTAPSGSTVPGTPTWQPGSSASANRPTVIGQGWTAVLEVRGVGSELTSNGLLDQLTTSVGDEGARLLQTALVNAVILPDGRVFVGAIPGAALQQVAANTAD